MVVYLPNLKQICQVIKEKCAVLFLREVTTFGSLNFHFISILVLGQRKTTLSLELTYIFSIHILIFLLSHHLRPSTSLSFFIESLSNLGGRLLQYTFRFVGQGNIEMK